MFVTAVIIFCVITTKRVSIFGQIRTCVHHAQLAGRFSVVIPLASYPLVRYEGTGIKGSYNCCRCDMAVVIIKVGSCVIDHYTCRAAVATTASIIAIAECEEA